MKFGHVYHLAAMTCQSMDATVVDLGRSVAKSVEPLGVYPGGGPIATNYDRGCSRDRRRRGRCTPARRSRRP
jgi:hypothetical protein